MTVKKPKSEFSTLAPHLPAKQLILGVWQSNHVEHIAQQRAMNHGLSKTNKVIPSTVEMLPSVFGQFSAWDYLHCQVFIGKLMPLGTMEPHQMCGLDSCLGKMHSSQRTWWRTATKLCGKLRLMCRLLLLLLSTCCITAVTLYPHQT